MFSTIKAHKGQGLSLTTIIIASLVLIVLIVLTVIFTSRIGLFNESLRHCDTICVDSASECSDLGYEVPVIWANCEDNQGNTFDDHAYCCGG